MHEIIFFRHFFDLLAVGGALAEWIVACWVLAGFGVWPPLIAHVGIPAVLAVANRLAARRLEREPANGFLAGRAGYVVLGLAFGGITGVVALAAAACACVGFKLLGGFQAAEAGMLTARASEALLGLEFRVLGSAALGVASGLVAYGYAHGYRRLLVSETDLPIAGLPPALAGLRIVHLSDLHLGPIADRAAVRDALARAVALEPDLICLTGDIIDSPAADMASWVPELAVLRARYGVLTILGNHDKLVGMERVAEALGRETGLRVLRDEVATVAVGNARLHVIGVEHQPPEAAAVTLPRLVATVPDGEPTIALIHHPNLFPATVAAGVDVTLAGHTHGGQVAMPFVPRLNVARLFITRYDAGTFTHGATVLHVNRGLGTSGQRVRVGAPREISVLRLVPAGAARAA